MPGRFAMLGMARVSLLTFAAAVVLLAGTDLTEVPNETKRVEIRSTGDCPSGDEITARLGPMLPSGWLLGPDGDRVTVDLVGPHTDGVAGFRLQLVHPDGSVGVDRRLLLGGSCSEKGDAIATVVAAWETDFASPGVPRPVPVPDAPAITVPASDAPPPAVPAPDAPAPVASAPPASIAQVSEPRQGGLGFSLGASAGAAMGGGIAATAGIEAKAGGQGSRWQLRASAAAQTSRQKHLDVGEVGWKHTTVAAGLVVRSLGPRWHFSVDAGPLVGWASLAGQGYSPSRTETVFEYGLAGGLRAERVLGRVAVWLELRANVWARAQKAVLTGSASSDDLPRVDTLASLGVSVTNFR
jgi:hypothetical protein